MLAHTVYPSPELRPMVDVDVLVPYARRRRALQVAQAAGFSLDSPQLFDGRYRLKHHYFLQNRAYHPIRLELHFRLLSSPDKLLTVEDQDWFWRHTSTLDLASGERVNVLLPEAHLLYLCAHAILQHGEAGLRQIHLYGLDRLLAATPGFDWNLLVRAAVRLCAGPTPVIARCPWAHAIAASRREASASPPSYRSTATRYSPRSAAACWYPTAAS